MAAEGSSVDLAELAGLLKSERTASGKSLRQVSAETGVPYSTLSRVEAGQIPDLSTFRNIVGWLGVAPERFFPVAYKKPEATPQVVAQLLRSDPSLSDQARDQLASVFETMYANLATSERQVSLHLRADRTFTPEAGALLADILEDIELALRTAEDL